jgi:NAD+ synthase
MGESLVPRLPSHTLPTLHRFLRAHVAEAGAKGVVVGLSGGIDSALVLRLAKDALGPQRVLAVSLPDARSSPALLQEVRGYASDLGVGFHEVALDPLERPFIQGLEGMEDRVARGNLKARLRMVVLYHEGRRTSSLVLGTGNKSELLLGYFTKYGDGGADLLPIGDLYKTSVKELSAQLDLPKSVRDRAPTAGLWEGQTDEGELGMSYDLLDQILYGWERLLEVEEVAERLKLPAARVEEVISRVRVNRHKRRPPPIPKLSLRTIGIDWRD